MSYSRKKTVKTIDKISDVFAISIGLLVFIPLFIIVLLVRAFEIGKEFFTW